MTRLNLGFLLLMLGFCTSLSSLALGKPPAGSGVEAQAKGPHGGVLLSEGRVAVELSIFEAGVAPEMRVYAYREGTPLDPADFSIDVALERLGGEREQLSFVVEADYRVSEQIIVEPHSYDITAMLSVGGESQRWSYSSYEGRTEISARLIERSGIESEPAGGRMLRMQNKLFGVIAAAEDRVFQINAPYAGLVDKVLVDVGDRVSKGQPVIKLKNTATLQRYTLASPAAGEVTERRVNAGGRAGDNALLVISDLSSVWVEMSAFPESIEKLALAQEVTIYDMHQHERAEGVISYISPQMTGGHIARARTVIDNPEGHWRPGMHILAEVIVAQREVPVAVRVDAIQRFRNRPAVFARFGNTFEVRPLQLGESDGRYVEVLDGLRPGTEYVTANSFLIKADVLKDDAGHEH